jgi:hypothetical protein
VLFKKHSEGRASHEDELESGIGSAGTGFGLGEWLVKPDDGSLVSSRRVTRLDRCSRNCWSLSGLRRDTSYPNVRSSRIFGHPIPERWLQQGKVLLRKTLGDSREDRFINRSQIVNLNWIEAAEHDINGRLSIMLRNGKQVEISRRQSRSLRELLSL